MVRFLRLPWRGATAISGCYVPSIIRSNWPLPLGKNTKKDRPKNGGLFLKNGLKRLFWLSILPEQLRLDLKGLRFGGACANNSGELVAELHHEINQLFKTVGLFVLKGQGHF